MYKLNTFSFYTICAKLYTLHESDVEIKFAFWVFGTENLPKCELGHFWTKLSNEIPGVYIFTQSSTVNDWSMYHGNTQFLWIYLSFRIMKFRINLGNMMLSTKIIR